MPTESNCISAACIYFFESLDLYYIVHQQNVVLNASNESRYRVIAVCMELNALRISSAEECMQLHRWAVTVPADMGGLPASPGQEMHFSATAKEGLRVGSILGTRKHKCVYNWKAMSSARRKVLCTPRQIGSCWPVNDHWQNRTIYVHVVVFNHWFQLYNTHRCQLVQNGVWL